MAQQESSQNSLIEAVKSFIKSGKEIFYFSRLAEKANVPIEEAESFIASMFRQGIIKGTLEVRCPECSTILGEYQRFSEIPEDIECEHCGCKFPRSLQYVEIVCKIVNRDFFRNYAETTYASCHKKGGNVY